MARVAVVARMSVAVSTAVGAVKVTLASSLDEYAV